MTVRTSVLLACATLAACATAYDAGSDQQQWFYSTDTGETKLVYGTPQSDDVALMLSCRPGSGRVTVSQGGLEPGRGIVLASSRGSVTLQGASEPDQLNSGVYVEAETPTTTAVLQDFRRSGRIIVGGEGGRVLYATPAERAQIEQFFAACG